jgi:hypothetical protein
MEALNDMIRQTVARDSEDNQRSPISGAEVLARLREKCVAPSPDEKARSTARQKLGTIRSLMRSEARKEIFEAVPHAWHLIEIWREQVNGWTVFTFSDADWDDGFYHVTHDEMDHDTWNTFKEMVYWADTESQGRASFRHEPNGHRGGTGYFYFAFELKTDAAFFKLRWL